MEDQALPFLEKPHDSIRHGLVNLKGDASLKHPVELAQTSHRDTQETSRLRMLRDLYGVAAPAKQQIERSILSKFERLPGLPSSKLGLESLTGTLDEFSFDSFIGLPYESETPDLPLHSVMEAKLGMNLDRITRPIV